MSLTIKEIDRGLKLTQQLGAISLELHRIMNKHRREERARSARVGFVALRGGGKPLTVECLENELDVVVVGLEKKADGF